MLSYVPTKLECGLDSHHNIIRRLMAERNVTEDLIEKIMVGRWRNKLWIVTVRVGRKGFVKIVIEKIMDHS